MYYAPHSLYKKVTMQTRDSLNRIISSSEEWQYVCPCRCDDNQTEKFEDENGRVYIPRYKVVSERVDIKEGDYIQCRVTATDKVRGEGRVRNSPKCNYLNYMVSYV